MSQDYVRAVRAVQAVTLGLLMDLLHPDMRQRFTAAQALQHVFFMQCWEHALLLGQRELTQQPQAFPQVPAAQQLQQAQPVQPAAASPLVPPPQPAAQPAPVQP